MFIILQFRHMMDIAQSYFQALTKSIIIFGLHRILIRVLAPHFQFCATENKETIVVLLGLLIIMDPNFFMLDVSIHVHILMEVVTL